MKKKKQQKPSVSPKRLRKPVIRIEETQTSIFMKFNKLSIKSIFMMVLITIVICITIFPTINQFNKEDTLSLVLLIVELFRAIIFDKK